jgi:hypothetical protein
MKSRNVQKYLSFTSLALVATLTGCGEANDSEELTGIADLSIVAAEGVGSVSIEFQGSSRVVSECLPVDGQLTTRLQRLPTGNVNINAAAFAGASCEGEATWFGEPQTVLLSPGQPSAIQIRFRPNGIVQIGTEFVPDAFCAGQTAPVSWADELDSGMLAPEWTVWEYGGPRNNGQVSPANRVSFGDSPGMLRYIVEPMTYYASASDYAPFQGTPYIYDPGLELSRAVTGERWTLDTKVSWHVPTPVNSAGFQVGVHLGPPGTAGFDCRVMRYSNSSSPVPSSNNYIYAECGPTGGSVVGPVQVPVVDDIVRHVRITRDDTALGIELSADGVTFESVATATLPDEIRCDPQVLQISGEAWFTPAGSYADYDYVRLTQR